MEKSLNVGTQSLLGYLPALLIKNILDEKIKMNEKLPQYTTINTVSLFADISGFTKLSETFSKKGRIGPEFLAFSLNRYMEQLINIIGKNGGDIFKFAGDALFVVWPEEKEDISRNCKRAIQCAFDIQKNLHNAKICNGKAPLSIKIGIGVGEVKILIVGGFFSRCEYLAIGKAVREACQSESMAAAGGETIMSQETFNIIKNFVKVIELTPPPNNHYKIDPRSRFYKITEIIGEKMNIKSETYLIRSRFAIDSLRKNVKSLKQFIPASITLYLDIEKEFWSKEIRMLSIMFLNLEFDMNKKEEEVNQMANLLITKVQRCVYKTRGGLNKFLMDDKGTLMLLCWGLPPMSNPDDHLRGVLSALSLMNDLKDLDCNAYMSLTTGTCFTGVCGTLGNRREYSLLGEVVNLSARFMQEAIVNGPKNGKKTLFLLDETTKKLIENKITCQYFNTFSPKGFSIQFKTFIPIIYEDKSLHKYFLKAYKFNPFPEIKTHKFNPILMGQIHKENTVNEEHAAEALKDSLFLIDREAQLSKFVSVIQEAYKTKQKKLVLVKGPMGSGKSLFLRRGFFEFLNNNKDFYESVFKTDTKRIFFCTYQTPITHKKPFNGFYKIFREMYEYLFLYFDEKVSIKSFKFSKQSSNRNAESLKDQGSVNSKIKRFNEEIISIIIEEKCFYLIKYLELILKKDLMGMFEKKFKKGTFKEESDQTINIYDKNNEHNANYNGNHEENEDGEVLNYAEDNLYTFNRTNSSDTLQGEYDKNNNENEEVKNFNFKREKEHIIIPEQFDSNFAELKFANYVNSKCLNNFFLRLVLLYQSTILDQDDEKEKEESNEQNAANFMQSRISTFNPNKEKGGNSNKNKFKSSGKREHLFLVIEDCNLLDSFSIEFFKLLIHDSRVKNISIIYTHQEQLFLHLEDKGNKFARCPEFFNEETVEVFFMNNVLNHEKVSKLIKFAIFKTHLKDDKVAISKIESALIDIIISKSFKGNPFFIYEITESLLNSKKLIQHLSTEILVTTELLEMEKIKNWCEFKVPIVIEKLIGAIIDSLSLKNIIILKLASVIGSVFDIHSLMEINEFANTNNEEMYNILKSLEGNGILEFLWDKGPKQLICKFSLPFFREILYQRMLIEQKNELHLKVARTLQNSKFRYYSHETEVRLLNLHLRNSERTLLVQMEEDDSVEESYNKLYRDNMAGGNNLNKWAMRSDDDSATLNISNLKIFLVKDIVEKILKIEKNKNIVTSKSRNSNAKMPPGGGLAANKIVNRFGRSKSKGKSNDKKAKTSDESNVNKSLQCIISGIINKKSDKNITWENRFCVATTNKFLYWYTQEQYFDNKVCLGKFSLSNILEITILPDFHIGGRKNIISIYISSWYKKEELKGPRKYILSFNTRKELYEWTMTLNFLRVKAIHDDFTLKFGIVNLPLKFELKRKTVKILKRKFTPDPNLIYEERAFESSSVRKKESDVVKIRKGSLEYQFAKSLLLRRTTGFSRISNMNLNFEEFEKNQLIILKNTKNELKELIEKGFLCFLISVQNLALNYEDDNDIFDSHLIKVPEAFCNRVFKSNSVNASEIEINPNKGHKISDASSSIVDDSVRNSFNSFIMTNQDIKNSKTLEKTHNISNNNISSLEDSNDKILEDKKRKEIDLNNLPNKSLVIWNKQESKNFLQPSARELSITKDIKMQLELDKKRKEVEERAKQDQLLREKIRQLVKKEIPKPDESDKSNNNNDNRYQKILKNVQESSLFNKIIYSVNGSKRSKSPTNDFKRSNIRNENKSLNSSYKDRVLSGKSKERVIFRENALPEEKLIFESSSSKNFTLNDINSNKKYSGGLKPNKNSKDNNINLPTDYKKLKNEDVFVNYQYHNYLNKKFNRSSSTKNIESNFNGKYNNQNNSVYHKLNENSFVSDFSANTDYYKLYNIKKSEDHDAFSNFNIIDPNLPRENETANGNNINYFFNKKKSDYNYLHELNQEDKLISKLKSFVIEMPNDDDEIFNMNQDFFEKKTTTTNGLEDKLNGGIEEDNYKKYNKRRSSLPNVLDDKNHENDSYYSKKTYRNHESNLFGMFKNI